MPSGAIHQQLNAIDVLLYISASAISVVVPVVIFVLCIWLAARAGSFLLCLVSPDGGDKIREQRQRHRLENRAALLTLTCFAVGIYLTVAGQGEGNIVITLPGRIEMEQVGAGVAMLGVGTSLIWLLLQFRKLYADSEASKIANKSGDELRRSDIPSMPMVTSQDKPQISDWRAHMTYWHVGLITIVLLPFVNVFAIPVGVYLAWIVSKRQKPG
jgi:hypothetical protein